MAEQESAQEEYVDRTDIVIENNIATWSLKAEGAILGTYTGVFKFKCFLTPNEIVDAGRERRDLLGQNAMFANENESFYAYALTQLKYRVISGPPFWESSKQSGKYAGDIADVEILGQILDAALGSELKFKFELNKRKTQAIERAKAAAEQIIKAQQIDKAEADKEDQE